MITEFYKKESGESPVEDFIDTLEKSLQSKVVRSLERLEDCAANINEVAKLLNTRQIKGKLWELKIDNVRLFYVIKNNEIHFLHGFIKKTIKTPNKEKNVALSRMHSF